MNIENILPQLAKVRKTAPGEWVACCPAHEDRTPSLSLKDCGDGRILMHCFGGCAVEEVCLALGLTLSDLMPERVPDKTYRRMPFNAATVLRIIAVKAGAAAIASNDLAAGKTLTGDDKQALFDSAEFIHEALEYVRADR